MGEENVSWCATCSKEDLATLNDTIKSINDQTVRPYEFIITTKGNIAQGRNEYLSKVNGDYIASFDGGCLYEKDYTEKMLRQLKNTDSDIVMSKVKPFKPKNKVQQFCAKRLPDYEKFNDNDWNNFIPSNRQVIFKKSVIKTLGLIPEELWRADDTYWFTLARKRGLKFTHCDDATVYWETKNTLKSYLWSVYNDNKADKQFNVQPFNAPKKSISYSLYGIPIAGLALLFKYAGKLAGTLNSKSLTLHCDDSDILQPLK